MAAAGYPTTQRYAAVVPGPVGVLRLRAPIGEAAWMELAARGGALFAELGGGGGSVWTARVGVGAGVSF